MLTPCNAMTRSHRLNRGNLAAQALFVAILVFASAAAQYQPSPRWGQASALAGSNFVVHGGHTNAAAGGGYSFMSGPTTAEILVLDMSRGFTTTAAPWKSINGSLDAPAVAFHTLTAFQGDSKLLVFGGETSISDSTPNDSNSAFVAQLSTNATNATWQPANTSWNQPARRIFHKSECDGTGNVWIVGGEKPDGSNIEYDQGWTIDTSNANAHFSQMPQPPAGLVGATLTYIEDNRLVLLGGLGLDWKLASLENLTTFNVATGTWQTINAEAGPAGFPAPRRNHIAVSLPQKRILIQGGGDGSLLTAFGDTWILDWGWSPPRWCKVPDIIPGGPSPRFGHSAVAYGSQAALAFGWAGNKAADSQVYNFDAGQLAIADDGTVTGVKWSTTYTPDYLSPQMSPTSDQNKSNTSASQSESSDNTSSDSGAALSTNGTQPASGSTNTTDGFIHSHNNGGDGGPNARTTAAIVVGCFLGLSVLAAVSYFAYRRQLQSSRDWHQDGGMTKLLHDEKPPPGFAGSSGHEKDLESGPFLPTSPIMGQYGAARRDSSNRLWIAANAGHAFEGPGPHFGQRLALMTGLSRAHGPAPSHRFDMLADEDEDRDYDGSIVETSEAGDIMELPEMTYRTPAAESRSELVARGLHTRTHSRAAIIEQYADMEDAVRYDDESTLPPSDERELEGGTVSHDTLSTRRSTAPTSGRDHDDTTRDDSDVSSLLGVQQDSRRPSIISFSDAPAAIRKKHFSDIGLGVPRLDSSSPLVRRSPTWWQRFMNQNFLERSPSGRLSAGPNAEQPIRDPTEPPALGVIRERSATHSASGSVGEEVGGRNSALLALHDRSRSSFQTATSSILEDRMRNMDVVQRIGSMSTRRTASTGPSEDIASEPSWSRQGHYRHASRSAALSQSNVGWETIDEGGDGRAETSIAENPFADIFSLAESLEVLNFSTDIAELSLPSAGLQSDEEPRTDLHRASSQSSSESESDDEDAAEQYRGARLGVHPQRRQVSEALSVTPSATKRARKNSRMTNPFSPEPPRTKQSVLQGSVLDHVRAIERKWTEEGDEAVLPLPRSQPSMDSLAASEPGPSSRVFPASPVSDRNHSLFVPSRGGRPIPTRVERKPRVSRVSKVSSAKTDATTSPTPSTTKRYSHGFAPKPQLYVANPDQHRQGSSTSG